MTFDSIPARGFSVTPPKTGIQCGAVMKVAEIAPPASGRLQVEQSVDADTLVNLRCADFASRVIVRENDRPSIFIHFTNGHSFILAA
jgi:hypothetical protein